MPSNTVEYEKVVNPPTVVPVYYAILTVLGDKPPSTSPMYTGIDCTKQDCISVYKVFQERSTMDSFYDCYSGHSWVTYSLVCISPHTNKITVLESKTFIRNLNNIVIRPKQNDSNNIKVPKKAPPCPLLWQDIPPPPPQGVNPSFFITNGGNE